MLAIVGGQVDGRGIERAGAVDDGARGEQRRQQEQARHAAAEVAEEAGRSL